MTTPTTTYALINVNGTRTVHLADIVVTGVYNGKTHCGLKRAESTSWAIRGTGTATTCLHCDTVAARA